MQCWVKKYFKQSKNVGWKILSTLKNVGHHFLLVEIVKQWVSVGWWLWWVDFGGLSGFVV